MLCVLSDDLHSQALALNSSLGSAAKYIWAIGLLAAGQVYGGWVSPLHGCVCATQPSTVIINLKLASSIAALVRLAHAMSACDRSIPQASTMTGVFAGQFVMEGRPRSPQPHASPYIASPRECSLGRLSGDQMSIVDPTRHHAVCGPRACSDRRRHRRSRGEGSRQLLDRQGHVSVMTECIDVSMYVFAHALARGICVNGEL